MRLLVEDKLRAEMALARANDVASLPPRPWRDDLAIGLEGLGVDSLELMSLAASINEMFHIHEIGTEEFLLKRRTFGRWVDLALEAHRANPAKLTFQTSGSSGAAKRCTLDLHRLADEAAEHAGRLRPRRVLSAVPAHHVYGFIFTILLPLQAGCEVVDLRDQLPRPDDFACGDLIVSFPDHWRFLARSLERLPAVTGVTSTAPMPAAEARELRARGLARLVEIYGSSETAGLGWRDEADAPYALLDGWQVRQAPEGEGLLHLDGPGGATCRSPDYVVMTGPRSFHVRGRADGAVQVGGVNVFPDAVARTLERHPLVASARIRLAPPGSGGRLKALVVSKDPSIGIETVRRELESWIKQTLPAAEQPRSLTVARALPKTVMGKDADWLEMLS